MKYNSTSFIPVFFHNFVILFFLCNLCQGQTLLKNSTKTITIGGRVSSNAVNPFWFRTAQNGTSPYKSNHFYLSATFYKEYDSTYNLNKKLNKFNLGFGFQPIANIGKKSEIIFPDAYIKLRYGIFELMGGNRREISGLVDSTLSSGSYAISNNALPYPKIQISIPNYWRIFKNFPLSIKGDFSIGHLGEQYYVKNQIFHKKSFYGRIGKDNWPIQLLGGFNHQFQFGGELNNIKTLNSIAGNKFPESFKDFVYAISGISLNKSTSQEYIDTEEYTAYDLTNRVGNHFGSIDVGLNLILRKTQIMIYRQSVYDDGGLFYLNNIFDGLNGVSITLEKTINPHIKLHKINLEYFNSSNQGGPIPPGKESNAQTRGADNYFNHGQFLDGWSYQGQSLGSPFITPHYTVIDKFPKYTNRGISEKEVLFFSNNNRVKAIHAAFSLSVYGTNLTLHGSHSKNFGTYRFPFVLEGNQLSLGLFSITPLIKYRKVLMLDIGFDNYGIFSKTIGTRIGITQLL
jgi:hypothetical protein